MTLTYKIQYKKKCFLTNIRTFTLFINNNFTDQQICLHIQISIHIKKNPFNMLWVALLIEH